MTRKRKGRSQPPPGNASAHEAQLPGDNPRRRPFVPEVLDSTVIAVPLLKKIERDGPDAPQSVMIDLNLDFAGGKEAARQRAEKFIEQIVKEAKLRPSEFGVDQRAHLKSKQYVCARLPGAAIRQLVKIDKQSEPAKRVIYKIWPDFEIGPLTNCSISTVKADAARNAFGAFGKEIVWAVLDSGIDGSHSHFEECKNLDLPEPLKHADFVSLDGTGDPLVDVYGHGTHVAGIIAGQRNGGVTASRRFRDENGQPKVQQFTIDRISGMASQCKLLSLKVLDHSGRGKVSNLIAALEYVAELNGNGRLHKVHGVNLSVGYNFEPEWFACGQSPLCVELNRLVRSGVVAVVAAGNTGYGFEESAFRGTVAAGMELSINDPGNADLAITVGSTHRESPHQYGVSYFSSKGPTGDGRMKPDLVAPGEKIISCASGQLVSPSLDDAGQPVLYREDSGTSMAAPHVSGVIAAFLSIRREFIGQPESVKNIFIDSATDLRRAPTFQGRGLVDLMRAIQSV